MKKQKQSQVAILQPYILSLIQYMGSHGFVSAPIPKIRLVQIYQGDNPLRTQTGHYSPEEDEIVL